MLYNKEQNHKINETKANRKERTKTINSYRDFKLLRITDKTSL